MSDLVYACGLGLLIGFVIGVIGTYKLNEDLRNRWQSEAVSSGAAEWVVDQKTGKTTFKWKEKQ